MVDRQRAVDELGAMTSFWEGRRVFLTGHTGFKGSWLSLWLARLGAQVRGFALAPDTDPSLFVAAGVEHAVESLIGDIRDPAAVRDALTGFRPDIVLHLAAQPLVRRSYREPVETFATNVMGTLHVLEAARACDSARVVVNVTTDKCYANREWVWGYREDEPMGGHDPYSASKGCAELATAAWRASFFAPEGRCAVATARAGNVIGGGDWSPDRLIPDLLRAMAAGEPAIVRNPHATRPWQHVLEPLGGYLLLAERLWEEPSLAQAWNFGPRDEDARPVGWIADRIVDRWGNGASWRVEGDGGPHEANALKLDISKARAQLGWAPRWELETTLSRIAGWHKAWAGGADPRALVEDEIAVYEAAAVTV